MVCRYMHNGFCSALPDDIRDQLCASCRIKEYAAKTIRELSYWRRGPALLVDGFGIFGNTSKSQGQQFVSREFVHQGEFVSWGERIDQADDPCGVLDCFEFYCFTDCVIAFWDIDVFDRLYNNDIRFLKVMVKTFINGWGNAEEIMSCTTAYDKLHFYLDYCRHNGFNYATHEQIAVACNLSRQTVTKLMAEATKKEPELFTATQEHR